MTARSNTRCYALLVPQALRDSNVTDCCLDMWVAKRIPCRFAVFQTRPHQSATCGGSHLNPSRRARTTPSTWFGTERDEHEAALALDLQYRGFVGLELLDGRFQRRHRFHRLSVQLVDDVARLELTLL